jgi:hypothetical protein
MTSDHLLIERLNRIFGFGAVLDGANYDDRETWTWNFVPSRYEGEEGLTWVESLIDISGAWDKNVWWDANTDRSEYFTINHYTCFLSAMNIGKIYWLKKGVLECITPENLKKLLKEDLGDLLLRPRRECDQELKWMVETVDEKAVVVEAVEQDVEDEGKREEVVRKKRKKRKKRKNKDYLEYLGGNAVELDWATGVS